MRSKLEVVVLLSGLMFQATAANALTLDPSNTLHDAILTNRVANGPTYDMTDGAFTWGAVVKNGDHVKRAVFRFTNSGSQDVTVNLQISKLLLDLDSQFRNVRLKWRTGDTTIVTKAGPIGAALDTVLAAGEKGVLKVIFGNPRSRSAGDGNIQLQVQAIAPVPAPVALPLMASALLGLGLLSRRRHLRRA